jgi:hypothetical protein
MSDSGEWISVNIEVVTDDLCSVYGCNGCPGFVKTEDGQLPFATTSATLPLTPNCLPAEEPLRP